MKLCTTHGIHTGRTCPTCRTLKIRRYADPTYQANRRTVLAAQPACQVCGARTDLTVDHIVPIARGGGHSVRNLQTLCRGCNGRKGARRA